MSNPLNGRIITSVNIAEDKQAIQFMTTDGPVMARCDGDCCSYTWIEHIENVAALIDARVTFAEDIDMPDIGDMPDREVVSYYGLKIVTDKGTAILDYRNESNGYYGGCLCWGEDEYFYGGVHGQNVSALAWRPLLEDF